MLLARRSVMLGSTSFNSRLFTKVLAGRGQTGRLAWGARSEERVMDLVCIGDKTVA